MPLLKKINGYEIWESDRHGKCVAGRKKSNGIQVRFPHSGGYLLKANFQYKVGEVLAKQIAITKAEKFIADQKLPSPHNTVKQTPQ